MIVRRRYHVADMIGSRYDIVPPQKHESDNHGPDMLPETSYWQKWSATCTFDPCFRNIGFMVTVVDLSLNMEAPADAGPSFSVDGLSS